MVSGFCYEELSYVARRQRNKDKKDMQQTEDFSNQSFLKQSVEVYVPHLI